MNDLRIVVRQLDVTESPAGGPARRRAEARGWQHEAR